MAPQDLHVIAVVLGIVVATCIGAFGWVRLAERTARRRFADIAVHGLRHGSRSRGASDSIPSVERRRIRAGRPVIGHAGPEWGIHPAPRAD